MTSLQILILLACGIGAITDLRSSRIPNVLSFCTVVLALALHVPQGASSLAVALLCLAAVMAIGFALFSLRLIGGGDIKLMAGVACAASFPGCVTFLLYTMLAGGLLALFVAARRGSLRASFYNASTLAYPALYYRTAGFVMPSGGIKMPYGVAIFAGALALVASQTFAPFLRLFM